MRLNSRPMVLRLGALLVGGAAAACAASAADSLGFDGTGPGSENPKADAGGSSSGGSNLSSDVDGVIVVHASRNLPAFRVCFGNRPNLAPLPDSKLMPQSNVVGVEVGAAVHVGALHDRFDDVVDGGKPDSGGTKVDAGSDSGVVPSSDAGAKDGGSAGDAGVVATKLYVFREDALRYRSQLCGDLLKDASLQANKDYFPLDFAQPGSLFTQRGVYLVSVEGCIAASDPQLTETTCGKPYVAGQSNLSARLVQLTSPRNEPGAFYAQSLVLSSPVRDAVLKGQTAGVYFGEIAGNLERFDGENKLLDHEVQPATPQRFAFPDALASYETYGFRVKVGNTPVDQSLARTQELTNPGILPSAFYRLPSNFVVLVLGDPAVSPKTDPGLGLHLLAIPVRDPDSFTDAGTD